MIYTVTFNPAIDYVVRLDAPLEVGEVNRAKGEDCVLVPAEQAMTPLALSSGESWLIL